MQVIETLSEPGSAKKNNEDIFGHTDSTAWVFDGATSLADEKLVASGDMTDPRWIVEQANDSLNRHADQISDMRTLYKAVLADCTTAFAAAARRELKAHYEYPMAASLVIKQDGDQVTCGTLSDCSLIIETVDGLKIVAGDEAHAALDALSAAKMAEEIAKGCSMLEARANTMPLLKKNRSLANKPGGYSVFAPEGDISDQVRLHHFNVKSGASALLMTDGFYALVDKYGAYDDQSLLEAAKTKGLKALYTQLREIENADDSGAGYARTKKSDDATALLVRF